MTRKRTNDSANAHAGRASANWRRIAAGFSIAALCFGQSASALDAGEQQFRGIYKELVETDTSLSSGSCTRAAQNIAARLISAGYPQENVRLVIPENFPRQGNLVVEVPGKDASRAAVLFLAHIDVVEAKPSDWLRDPFTLIEEDGYFYARGAVDDKAMAASFVDTLVRFAQGGFSPNRTIKFAFTCGEETDSVFNGLTYILENHRDLVSAAFAINEGGKGLLGEDGAYKLFGIEAGQKIYQDFTLTTTAPGGHSARPVAGNAIGRLSRALERIDAFTFPVDLIDVSRTFFGRSADIYEGQTRKDMAAIGAGRAGKGAFKRISDEVPVWNAMLRTTCIPTLVEGGHAENAQPQHAQANVNCRILPGQSVASVQATLASVINDPQVEITLAAEPGPVSAPPPLTPELMAPIDHIAGKLWPGVPVIPSLSTGATDGRFLIAAGIPTYGVSGMFVDPDGNGVFGFVHCWRGAPFCTNSLKPMHPNKHNARAKRRCFAGLETSA